MAGESTRLDCRFCQKQSANYTCPRCHAEYCGLSCYQSRGHSGCSEEFYKDCVKAELTGDNLSPEAKHQMQQILRRMKESEDDGDGGDDDDDDDDVDSDDSEEETDLADRLRDIDLDDGEAVWSRLSKEEQRRFEDLLRTGEVENILPEYQPYWRRRFEAPKIQEIGVGVPAEYKEAAPPVWQDIPPFSSIFPQEKSPSEYVKYSLLNLLYAYAYSVRFLYGDYENSSLELVEIVEKLAGSLKGQNFELADTAIEAAASEVNNHEEVTVSLAFSRSVKKDVYQIVKGPSLADPSFYILAALSDLRRHYVTAADLLKQRRPAKPSSAAVQKIPGARFAGGQQVAGANLDRTTVKSHLKKVEFFLSWTLQYYPVFADL